MTGYFSEIVRGAASLLSGLGVTLRALVARPVTVQYPREKIPLQPGFRGHPVLVREPGSGRPRCIACGACARACPSQCIRVEGAKREGDSRKYPEMFILDFTRCSLCGTCADVCPAGALAYSRACGAAGVRRDSFILDLLNMPESSS